MVSVIVPAYREEKSIGKALKIIIDQLGELGQDSELILVCPDTQTRDAARRVVEEKNFQNFVYIKDKPGKYGSGKINALNLAFERAMGDILVCTDADVVIGDKAIPVLLKHFSDKKIGGVTGRPVCANDRNNIYGYWGHMFMDAAHRRRMETLGKGRIFHLSGYLLAMRNLKFQIPTGVLDDVYISYKLADLGYKLAYEPDAKVFVRQPGNIKDWLRQKIRSVSGEKDMLEYFENSDECSSRSFSNELKYIFYPLSYASTLKEFFWGLLQYPVRLYTWVMSWWLTRVRGKKPGEIWKRVDTTK
ncbi:glycosyltransferase [Candidatus Dojkabacteria bacterium]|nr:glycosyltransferase [Candidatus Dojkabacteria bacterium]